MRNFLITLILVLIVGSVGLAMYKMRGLQRITNNADETSMLTDNEDGATGHKPVAGPMNSYTMTVPIDFQVESQGDYSFIFHPQTDELGAGPTNFIYISVAPRSVNGDQGEVYNYNPADFAKLVSSEVGESVIMGDSNDEALNEFFTYERIGDRMVGGYGAKAFQNSKPWEFPAGTTEYRYIVETEPAHYIVGAYLGNDESSGYYISQEQLEKLLATLKLTPDQIVDESVPTTNISWETFSNPSTGVSFKYPSNWQKNQGGGNFPSGDLLSLTIVGQTQRTQTELYDGASIAVMSPVASGDDANQWTRNRYTEREPADPNRPPEFSQVSYGGIQYERAYVCGLGCFEYFHTKQNGKIYGFMLFAVGPQEAEHRETFKQTMETVRFAS